MPTIKIEAKGHTFSAEVFNLIPDGPLGNGAPGFTGEVRLRRDGAHVGDWYWDPEGISPGAPDLMPAADDSEDVYCALNRAIRDELTASWRATTGR